MLKNYSVVPFKNFYCSQNYDGAYSHYSQSHSTNGIKSYPIDIVDDIYCGCDEMQCIKINGVGTGTVNQLFVCSTSKVLMPDGTSDYITYLITHPNDADIKANAYVGKKYKRGDLIIHQGTDGGVGSHIDLVIGKGQLSWWVQNSYQEWVLPNSIKPESGMYLDNSFTKVSQLNGIQFKVLPDDAYLTIPEPVEENREARQVKVICGDNTLRVRAGHNTNANIIGFAKPGFYNIISIFEDGTYNWYEVESGKWFASAEGCTQYIPELEEEPVIDVLEPELEEKEEDNTNTLNDTETTENKQEDKEIYIHNTDKENVLVWIITLIGKLIRFLFKKRG